MAVLSTKYSKTSPGSTIPEYDEYLPIWKRTRAILGGEKAAKEHDSVLDIVKFSNLLIPFSPSMTQQQYRWYLAEAELPGMTSQYSKILLGGLLRKPPNIKLPDSVPQEALTWIESDFTEDNRPIMSFLDEAVYEELCSSRCWISVDYPVIENYDALTAEQKAQITPYPVVWRAEDVINWQTAYDYAESKPKLARVVFRYVEKNFTDNLYHATYVPMIADHYLDESGEYCVDYYQREGETDVEVLNGKVQVPTTSATDMFGEAEWVKVGETIKPLISGEPLTELPIFPLNGEVDLRPPLLTPLIDKEISLYNKMSRRNHLLYGASTYTPVLKSDMLPEDFEYIVSRGLGSWIQIGKDDAIDVLQTPVEALSDLDRAIEAAGTEMANLGTRLLTPDVAESGIALQIRNAPQTAQLGTLNMRISTSMRQIIAMMLHWRYGEYISPSEVEFTLSEDFNIGSISQDAAYMLTEWYQSRLIPRSVWLNAIKKLELIPADYNDEEGQQEIQQDTSLLEGAAPIMEEE